MIHEDRKMYSILEIKQVDDELRFLRGCQQRRRIRAGDTSSLRIKFRIRCRWRRRDAHQPVGRAKLGKEGDR